MKRLILICFVLISVLSKSQNGFYNGWQLTGNSVSTNTAFIGTTSNRSLLFKTNNTQRLKIDSLGRIGVNKSQPTATLDVTGTMSVSSNASLSNVYYPNTTNTLVSGVIYKNGNIFLHDFKISTTTGQNVFLGELAGNLTLTGSSAATEGSYNAAIGYGSGNALTTGNFNAFLGHNAGAGCTTCGFNVAIGRLAGGTMDGGQANIYIGEQTGGSNANSQNVAMGQRALFSATNTTGSTGIGYISLQNTQGNYNIALGYSAGHANITGASNVLIGNYAGTGIKYQSNKLYIDNQSRADSAGVVSKSLIYGVFAATAASQTLTVNGNLISANRFLQTQGAAVASANNLVLGKDGSSFEITGTTQINLISNADYINGTTIRLLFTSTPTVKNGQATSGSNIKILLSGGVDFSATADDALTLQLSTIGGVQAWREVSRSVN